MSTSVSLRASTRTGGGRMRVVPAVAGDHAAIHGLLRAIFGGPSRHEYKTSLEDPFYEPHDRLLAKCGPRIVGHAQLTRRVMQFGSLELPVTGLGWLGILPELRGRGLGHRLLHAAEEQMAQDGALLGFLRTRIPHFFRPTGWVLCGRYSRSEAPARSLLCGLLDRGFRHLHRRRRRLNIRPWRRMELPALVRIYNQNLQGTFGPLQRSEAYWSWLIRRGAYDQLYVVLDGPDLLELEENLSPIVGYAATRGDQIIEIQTAPDHRPAAAHLLARACGDAIERGYQRIVLHAPPKHRLHKLFRSAGGRQHYDETDRGEVIMARLLDPLELLRRMGPELRRRAEQSNLPPSAELGLLAGGDKYHLTVNRRAVEVTAGKIGRSYLRLSEADFTRLLLGHLDWKQALTERSVETSTASALKIGRALFPRLPLWRPPLDDLPA